MWKSRVLLTHMYGLLCQCWSEGAVPQDVRDERITNLYKNKGDRSDCSNYRGISLLSIVGKLFTHVALIRLQKQGCMLTPVLCGIFFAVTLK